MQAWLRFFQNGSHADMAPKNLNVFYFSVRIGDVDIELSWIAVRSLILLLYKSCLYTVLLCALKHGAVRIACLKEIVESCCKI